MFLGGLSKMHDLMSVLTKELDHKTKLLMSRRMDLMLSQIKHLRVTDENKFKMLSEKKWDFKRIETICILNSFYQLVLAPLESLLINTRVNLGNVIPINYGMATTFDKNSKTNIDDMVRFFYEIIDSAGIRKKWLESRHASDMIYFMAKDILKDDIL